jgi:hypothetical protein
MMATTDLLKTSQNPYTPMVTAVFFFYKFICFENMKRYSYMTAGNMKRSKMFIAV